MREPTQPTTATTTAAALGFRAHSGWAALVAVTGPPHSPAVVDRRRVELANLAVAGSNQPYHAAQGLDLEEAQELVRRSTDEARRRAQEAFRAIIDDLRAKGHDVVGCGILMGSGRPATTLAATLASHALIHTAEGELFRDALAHAAERHRLPITRVREKELYARSSTELSCPAQELQRRIAELGRAVGPPWTQDQKHAALVGWLALLAAQRCSG